MTHHETVVMLTSLGTMLFLARLLGELFKKIQQPAVLGEILAGIILGPTIFGTIAPDLMSTFFPSKGPNAIALSVFSTFSVVLFLLVAGIEVNLSSIWKQGKTAFKVGISGIVFPFIVGFTTAWYFPQLLGQATNTDNFIFALLFATALSISALPVIAKTLMDLGIYRSDLGMLIISAAIFNDIVGWIVFAIILGMAGTTALNVTISQTIALTLAFTIFTLTIGRWIIHRILPWIKAYAGWPGGLLGLVFSLSLFGAAFTECIGIHAIFGSFIIGIAIGDSSHLRERSRKMIEQFVSFIFAPIFFVSIGLKVNFIENFDFLITLVVIVTAFIGKLSGCLVGGKLSGMAPKESMALGIALNARGAMEIILGDLARQYGLISEKLFVSIVIMAIVTSILVGPLIKLILKHKKVFKFTDFLNSSTFKLELFSKNKKDCIEELVEQVCKKNELNSHDIKKAVLDREALMSTGLGYDIAVPHAKIKNLNQPIIGFGLSKEGIDFNSPDGKLAKLVFLILTPTEDKGAQVQILSDIAKTYYNEGIRKKVMEITNYTEFLAIVQAGDD